MTWHTNISSTPSTSLQEQEAAFSLTSYLDTIRLERAKSNPTQEMSSSPDNETESCQPSPSGTTYAHSTEHPGEEQLMFFAEASPVRTSVRQVKEQELRESVRDFGRNMRDSLERCGLALSLPKTHLCFALGDLELSSKTWPRWGIMLDGECSELGMSVRHINETECGSWPTPTTMETLPQESKALHKEATVARPGRSENHRTFGTVCIQNRWKHAKDHQKWPTPCTRDYKGINSPEGLTRKDGRSRMDQLPNAVAYGGTQTPQKAQLNPSWVEWLMGWPIGWTDLKPLVTDKFHSVQLWHSLFSQKD
jgi:hypothetical protein